MVSGSMSGPEVHGQGLQHFGSWTSQVSHLAWTVCLARIFITSYALPSRVRSACEVFLCLFICPGGLYNYLLSSEYNVVTPVVGPAIQRLILCSLPWSHACAGVTTNPDTGLPVPLLLDVPSHIFLIRIT